MLCENAPTIFLFDLARKERWFAPGSRKKRALNALNVVAGHRLVIAIVVRSTGLICVYTCPRNRPRKAPFGRAAGWSLVQTAPRAQRSPARKQRWSGIELYQTNALLGIRG